MKLRDLIGRADPRILVLAAITGLGVLFSVYQAVGALSGNESSPEYRRSPPSAFALPLVDTLVDPQRLTEPRLPDEAYLQIEKKTMELSSRIAAQKLTARYLTGLGLSSVRAAAVIRTLNSYYPIYARRNATADKQISLGSVTGAAAETSQTISFGSGNGGAPGGSFTVSYQFSYQDGDWRLTQLIIDF